MVRTALRLSDSNYRIFEGEIVYFLACFPNAFL